MIGFFLSEDKLVQDRYGELERFFFIFNILYKYFKLVWMYVELSYILFFLSFYVCWNYLQSSQKSFSRCINSGFWLQPKTMYFAYNCIFESVFYVIAQFNLLLKLCWNSSAQTHFFLPCQKRVVLSIDWECCCLPGRSISATWKSPGAFFFFFFFEKKKVEYAYLEKNIDNVNLTIRHN